MSGGHILIIEDSPSLAQTYAALVEAAGHRVTLAVSGAEADERVQQARRFDAILLDLQLPDADGIEWLARHDDLASQCSIIVVTADGSINRAIAAMRHGAYDFLVKPVSPERLATTVRNAVERSMLDQQLDAVRQSSPRDHFHGFIGRAPVMQGVYRAIDNVADSKATVFITGESGTGKEVAADAIHHAGRRSKGPFVAINCGAIPENLLESELFGHVKGAFTGAVDNRIGAARQAHGGTLFLDEICEMELKLQVKLLRFLQTGMIQRVGDPRTEQVDVRVICATNRDPVAEVAAGRFREDLFYRLAVIPLDLPPLRDRGDDIGLIAQAFLDRFAAEEGRHIAPLDSDVLDMLIAHQWPGNVRELQNAVRRALVMSRADRLTCDDFAAAVGRSGSAILGSAQSGVPLHNGIAPVEGMTLAQLERWAVEQAIERTGSLSKAARELDVSPSTIYRMQARWASGG